MTHRQAEVAGYGDWYHFISIHTQLLDFKPPVAKNNWLVSVGFKCLTVQSDAT